MNLSLNIDQYQYEHFKPLQPHTSVWSTEKPYTVSGLVELPKPIYSTLSNFLFRKELLSNES